MISEELGLPQNVILHLTESCNLRCKMCYFWGETGCYSKSIQKKNPIEIDFEIVKQLIHDVAPAKPNYSLFGGEPLLYSRIEDLIVEIKSQGSHIDTPTNGTLLSKNAEMLVKTGFDSIRVSIDGSREYSDEQRGKGSYDKAIKGINDLHEARISAGVKKPVIGIIYTVTPFNYKSIQQFFLNDLDLATIDWITIQMENFLTIDMGEDYARFLREQFKISSDAFWRGMIRDPKELSSINTNELHIQVEEVKKEFRKLDKNVLLLPPTFTKHNLDAYINASWKEMDDLYKRCIVPWTSVDVVANGDIAPCHIFYDLVMGNLHEQRFTDIWNGENYRKFRKYMKHNKFMSICPGCCILYLTGDKRKKLKN
jgi:radical SAM protein with 4Fe4S-binding SPASM domain